MNAVLPFRRPQAATRLPRVVVINDSSVARGGATSLALLSARMLKERGHAVTFVAADTGDAGELAELGIETVWLGGQRINDQSKLKAVRQGLYNREAGEALAAFIARTDDSNTVYHVHVWSQIFSPAVFEALRGVAQRTFIHAHDFFLACPNGALFDFRDHKPCGVKPSSAACLMRNCDKRAYAHKLWRFSRHSILKRYFGEDTPWAGILTLHPDMNDLLKRGGLAGQKLVAVRNPAVPFAQTRVKAEENDVFCYVGRIEAGKGVKTLCRAARLAGVKLRVIGNFTQSDCLRREFPEVEFTGWVDRSGIGALLQDVRALVMPSQFAEPFGLVSAEASTSGVPLIVSKTAVVSREVAELGLGMSADVTSPQALADVMLEMAGKEAAEVKAMSEAAFNKEKAFSNTPTAWVEALQDMYAAAVAKA